MSRHLRIEHCLRRKLCTCCKSESPSRTIKETSLRTALTETEEKGTSPYRTAICLWTRWRSFNFATEWNFTLARSRDGRRCHVLPSRRRDAVRRRKLIKYRVSRWKICECVRLTYISRIIQLLLQQQGTTYFLSVLTKKYEGIYT